MTASWFALGAVLGGLAVGLGAFGAHGLRGRVGPDMVEIWQTGAHYHLAHALALLAVAWASDRFAGPWVNAAGWAFLAGIVLFSGSLYVLVLTGQRALGMVTPLGGVAFLVGWTCLALAALRRS